MNSTDPKKIIEYSQNLIEKSKALLEDAARLKEDLKKTIRNNKEQN